MSEDSVILKASAVNWPILGGLDSPSARVSAVRGVLQLRLAGPRLLLAGPSPWALPLQRAGSRCAGFSSCGPAPDRPAAGGVFVLRRDQAHGPALGAQGFVLAFFLTYF